MFIKFKFQQKIEEKKTKAITLPELKTAWVDSQSCKALSSTIDHTYDISSWLYPYLVNLGAIQGHIASRILKTSKKSNSCMETMGNRSGKTLYKYHTPWRVIARIVNPRLTMSTEAFDIYFIIPNIYFIISDIMNQDTNLYTFYSLVSQQSIFPWSVLFLAPRDNVALDIL